MRSRCASSTSTRRRSSPAASSSRTPRPTSPGRGPTPCSSAPTSAPGTLTDSGYARIVEAVAARNAALVRAKMIARRSRRAMSRSARSTRVDGDRDLADRSTAASTSIITRSATSRPTDGSSRRRCPTTRTSRTCSTAASSPRSRRPWQGHPAGALVAYSIPDLLAGKQPAIETVFVPNEHQAVEDVSASQSKLWVKYLDDVSGRLTALTRAARRHVEQRPGRASRQIDDSPQRDRVTRRTSRSRRSRAC